MTIAIGQPAPAGSGMTAASELNAGSAVMLYDGLCGFCDSTVQFVLAHDHGSRLRFAPLQGAFGREFLERHPSLAGVDSLVIVETDPQSGQERIYVRSDGVLRIAHHLGWPWRAAGAARVLPGVLRDLGYDAFARIRYRVFGRRLACAIPTPEQRALFID